MVRKKINKNDLSTKRRRVKTKRTWLFVFAGLLVFAGTIGFFRASIFRITTVEVVGVKNVPSDKIKAIAEEKLKGNYGFVIPKNNALFYPQEQIAATIASEFPRLSRVKVDAGLNGVLAVSVEEKVQNTLWCNEQNTCYAMDYTGFIFDTAPQAPEGMFVFRGLVKGDPIGQHFGTEQLVHQLLALSKNLSTLGFRILSITIESDELAEAVADNGTVIKFLPKEAKDEQLVKNISLFLNNIDESVRGNFAYIDARYGNKIFYKFKTVSQ